LPSHLGAIPVDLDEIRMELAEDNQEDIEDEDIILTDDEADTDEYEVLLAQNIHTVDVKHAEKCFAQDLYKKFLDSDED